jgi:hypothetical protein
MHDLMYYIHVIIDFFREGFREGFARVNAVLGLVIALIAAFMMPAWNRVWAITLGATVVALLAIWALPIVQDHAPFRLPSNLIEVSYWREALALYFGFLVVIAVFFFLKTTVMPKAGGGGKKH